MIEIYLKISIFILILNILSEILEKFFLKRKIVRNVPRESGERTREKIKTLVWSITPIMRWILLWAVYKNLTCTDAELVKILNKNNKGHIYEVLKQ
ncbi:hypothetical protein [Erysipelothrix anatis]|uniref:hypothetical protein n=1 Tax=Erysipelothrix anatis TaxID=2683713 RepID=UPI0013579623|nr:hypothetical protein [Erysipelothrix anatis]